MRFALLAVMSLISTSAMGQVSGFDNGEEGWRFAGPFPDAHISNADGETGGPAHWENGELRIVDVYGWTWVRAPASYEGDRITSLGGVMSFDILIHFSDAVPYPAVMLVGADRTLLYNRPSPTVGSWEHIQIPLSAADSGWVVNSYNLGDDATDGDMKAVLGDLRAILVLTEWNTGSDDTNLDNVFFPGEAGCPSDFDESGFVDLDDFVAFVQAFEEGTDNADFDRSGFVDLDDFIGFVAAFESGC